MCFEYKAQSLFHLFKFKRYNCKLLQIVQLEKQLSKNDPNKNDSSSGIFGWISEGDY